MCETWADMQRHRQYPEESSFTELGRGIPLRLELPEGAQQEDIRRPGLKAGQVEQHGPAQAELAVQGVSCTLHHVPGHCWLHPRVQHDNHDACRCSIMFSFPKVLASAF